MVVGIEADAQYVDFGRNRGRLPNFAYSVGGVGFANPDLTYVNPNGLSSLDFFGTVRGRIGYAFDRVLFYGTGGFAYGAGSNERSFGGFRGNDDFRTGYAAGGGIEYALPTDSFLNFFRSSAVTFKVEGLYVNLDRNNASDVFAVSNSTGVQFRTNTPYATTVGGALRRNDTEFRCRPRRPELQVRLLLSRHHGSRNGEPGRKAGLFRLRRLRSPTAQKTRPRSRVLSFYRSETLRRWPGSSGRDRPWEPRRPSGWRVGHL